MATLMERASKMRSRDSVELAIFVALGLLSLWVLAWLVGRASAHNLVWTGIDGLHASDPALYFGFIASAAHTLLVSDVFDTAPLHATYLHPGFLLSGLITHLGLSTWQVYLLWKPVAVVVFFLAVRAFVHRRIESTGGRRAALVLALFFVPTAAYIASLTHASATTSLYLFGIEVDMWPGTWLWGYSFTLLAVAAIPITLLCYERDRRRGRIGIAAPLAGALCAWLQPWQGATLLAVLLASELAMPLVRAPADGPLARRKRFWLLGVTAGAVAAPLVYYALLERLDSAWKLSGEVNRFGGWPVWAIAASIGPLALPALRAYWITPASWGDLALRIWPLAGLAVYWAIALGGVGTFPLHAFQGLTIPLGVLAVIGTRQMVRNWDRTRSAVALAVVAILVIPALVWKMRDASRTTRANTTSALVGPPETYFLKPSEADALQFLHDDPRSGAVLDAAVLGEVTPGRTGRATWVGLPSYTPDYTGRAVATEQLFAGLLSPNAAIAYVRSTHTHYLVEDCEHHADVASLITPLVAQTRQFGCAAVITLNGSAGSAG
jgi:hypothetical protein